MRAYTYLVHFRKDDALSGVESKATLKERGDKGNCHDTAVEPFFKTIKAELIWRRSWQTRRDAELAIFQYINGFYNPRQRHSALG